MVMCMFVAVLVQWSMTLHRLHARICYSVGNVTVPILALHG